MPTEPGWRLLERGPVTSGDEAVAVLHDLFRSGRGDVTFVRDPGRSIQIVTNGSRAMLLWWGREGFDEGMCAVDSDADDADVSGFVLANDQSDVYSRRHRRSTCPPMPTTATTPTIASAMRCPVGAVTRAAGWQLHSPMSCVSSGADVFLSDTSIDPGDDPMRRILDDSLLRCQELVAVLTEEAARRAWVIWETAWARQQLVIPIFPDAAPSAVPGPLRTAYRGGSRAANGGGSGAERNRKAHATSDAAGADRC